MSSLHFGPALEAALRDVLPSSDPLDQPDFNPIDHINNLFPTEESLTGIEPYTEELKARIATLDEAVLHTVRDQTSAGVTARKDLANAKASMHELFQKIRDIKDKAEQSEQMVHEICRDIKSLDYAKRHLTLTITALKRLQMLVQAVDQLAAMTRERMYPEAANLLQAVNQLLLHFEAYREVKKVNDLRDQISEISDQLRKQIFEDFNHLSTQEGTPQHAQFETLSGACAAVDALGPDVRGEMLKWFSQWQFAPYNHAFQPDGEAGSLDKTELRYGWLRRLLKQYDDQFSALFPPSWQVALAVTNDFFSITRKHLEEILDQSRGTLDAAVLTHALQKTVDFEKEMHTRFTLSDVAEETVADGQAAKMPKGTISGLLGTISGCFDSYMGIYVSLEDKEVEEAFVKIMVVEDWAVVTSGRADARVFNSSKELFMAIKRSFKRGTALRNSKVLLELLHSVWAKHLRTYARKVLELLPALVESADVTLPASCSLDQQQQQRVCAIVNTCVYCCETISQLEESITKTVGDDVDSDRIDLCTIKEDFQSVLTTALKVLVAALETRVTPALAQMCKVKWEAMDELSEDTSAYMLDIVSIAREMMPQLGEALSALYVRFFCEKFVDSFVPRLIGNVYRCRRIGEVGAQQMQVDVGTLKATLLDLPTLGQANVTNIYTKLVASKMARAEQVLKLVQTPEELLEVTVEEMQRSGVAIDLQKILELKGLKKAESEKIIEAMTSGSAQLFNQLRGATTRGLTKS